MEQFLHKFIVSRYLFLHKHITTPVSKIIFQKTTSWTHLIWIQTRQNQFLQRSNVQKRTVFHSIPFNLDLHWKDHFTFYKKTSYSRRDDFLHRVEAYRLLIFLREQVKRLQLYGSSPTISYWCYSAAAFKAIVYS